MYKQDVIDALEKAAVNQTKYIWELKQEFAECDVKSYEDEFAIGAFLLEQQLILHTLEEELMYLRHHNSFRDDVPKFDDPSEVVEYITSNAYIPKVIKEGLVKDGKDFKRLTGTMVEIDQALVNSITDMLCCLKDYNMSTPKMQETFSIIKNIMDDHLVMLELIHIYKKMRHSAREVN